MIRQEFNTASLQQLLDLPQACRLKNLYFLPLPNHLDVIIADVIADPALTTTAFVIPFLENGNTIFAQHARRLKLEIPGGHIEDGETMVKAAKRELKEETGYEATHLIPIGYQRIVCGGPKPTGYKYPFPHSFQQFFAGIVTGNEPYQPNEECGLPLEVTPLDAMKSRGPLHKTQRILFSAGFYKLFESGLIKPSLDTILGLPDAAVRPTLSHQ